MIGVLPLHEGSAALQTMFSFFSKLQVVGRFWESLMPFAVGPRHCGQCSFAVVAWPLTTVHIHTKRKANCNQRWKIGATANPLAGQKNNNCPRSCQTGAAV